MAKSRVKTIETDTGTWVCIHGRRPIGEQCEQCNFNNQDMLAQMAAWPPSSGENPYHRGIREALERIAVALEEANRIKATDAEVGSAIARVMGDIRKQREGEPQEDPVETVRRKMPPGLRKELGV